ncbi:hypothetical protein NUU61_001943 [Penicillium alfredii]|uniref:ER-bound oxygenase mpaB/mpaB'/Rubber oxygenase catalytic domain-containing protein n=1 Tax=Penicillium alfredii TaxID=1506179 RepID=A0A9W9KG63_9EURO|nr:uncharacterized protein NUU61_001943 [Penicillium alfredii]KAJ5104596.1 hypothetical protein NUU61_001943 [Penicillium alfredii]
MSSISPVSSLDTREAEQNGLSETEKNFPSTELGRLHALEQLEILPQILQEGIIFTGSGAALLLQAALPSIREAEPPGSHEKLASELLDTLETQISYISCLVFGTRTERQALIQLLQNGKTPLLGGHVNRFTNHPDLQLWIAATLYSTSTDVYQRVYGRVDYKSAQRAYSEFSLLMNCLGLKPNTWPSSRQEFWNYWDDQVSKLTVSHDAIHFAKDLRESTDMPQWVQTLKPLLRAVTIELLPPRLRDAYELQSTATTRALYRTWIGFSVALYPAMPRKWRSYPLNFYQDHLKEKLAA